MFYCGNGAWQGCDSAACEVGSDLRADRVAGWRQRSVFRELREKHTHPCRQAAARFARRASPTRARASRQCAVWQSCDSAACEVGSDLRADRVAGWRQRSVFRELRKKHTHPCRQAAARLARRASPTCACASRQRAVWQGFDSAACKVGSDLRADRVAGWRKRSVFRELREKHTHPCRQAAARLARRASPTRARASRQRTVWQGFDSGAHQGGADILVCQEYARVARVGFIFADRNVCATFERAAWL